jgi:di/tricarboxylate transporter
MESERIGMVEAVPSPQATFAGKTLRQINFREKYGLTVLAIYRAGQTRRSNLRDMPLRFGDALLVFGPRGKLRLLARELDFIVLTEEVQAAPRFEKAPLAIVLILSMFVAVGMNWLPISLAAVIASALMVLAGCLTMDEAYQAIEWKAIFLIASMLPLGTALQTSGAARFLADKVISFSEPYGIYALLGGLFLITLLASQVMPNPVVIVLMAPIALTVANDLNYSPISFMMAVAVAASSSFITPVGHAANILVMGPGSYKFSDYIKVGLPLVVITLVITLLVLPIFWPLTL